MPDFKFEAVTKDNETQTGQITAASAAAALAELESRGLTVHSLQQVEREEPKSDAALNGDTHDDSASDDQLLRERITAILEKRETLAPALEAFAEEMPASRRRRDLRRLAGRLRDGATVDELCQSKDLTTTWLPLLGGASSLESGLFLSDLFAESSRDNEVRTQWVRVFAYPMSILIVAMAVLVFLSFVVVPTFSSIFDDFMLELSDLTMMVVWFSDQVLSHLGRLLLITVACLAAIYVVLRLLSVLRFPGRVFDVLTNGSSRQVTVMATFVRRLAESLNTGLPLPTALRLAGHSSGKPWLLRKAVALAHGLETDWAENERPPWATGLPPSVVYALRAGADGGPNVRLLQEIAEIYAERVRNRFDWLTGLLPRLLILVVGFVVAMVALALFLPLMNLIDGLS
jgi:type II secretory pathway component PulF